MVTADARHAINELLEKARREGELDPYIGKRLWRRYRYGTRLEVTRDPAVFASSWYVTTHNVSGGGLGFWSKQAVSLGDPLFIRERSAGRPGAWLATHVRYCILGVNGYLVGVSFDGPGEPDAVFGDQSEPGESPSPSPAGARARLFCSSLRCRGGVAAALASGVVYFSAVLACQMAHVGAGAIGVWLGGAGVAMLLGFGAGWFMLWGESHTLGAIRRATENLSSGTPDEAPLPEAATGEVAAVRQAILDLGIRWRQQADLERLHRQRIEETSQIKTNVLSMVSHDLRTPLTSIQLYAQMLEEDLGSLEQEEQRKFLGVISGECTRLSRLVDDLLEVQRLERNEIDWPTQTLDLAETIRTVARAFEPIATSKGLNFKVNCPDRLTEVRVNPDKIAQAINNLLSNALKYTPPGGQIYLSARFTSTEVVIRVADTGPGIPREKWDTIFDRFVQLLSDTATTAKGVGLGLYITRQIVERHLGRVWLDSEVGTGSEFFIALPVWRANSAQALAAVTEHVAGELLICDADPDLASTMAQELRGHGFEVRQVHCGTRFFEQLTERPPDLVICDVVLPDMNYREFLERLEHVENRAFQLIFHSAGGSLEDLKSLGADIVLRRPVTRSELVEAVGVAMYKRADRGAVIVVTTGWGIDGDRMSQVLTASGHLPVAVRDVTEAIEDMHKYPVDAVIAFVGPEGENSPTRQALEAALGPGARLFALSSITDRNVCRKASTDRVTLVPYRPGHEELVVAEIDRVLGGRKTEVVS